MEFKYMENTKYLILAFVGLIMACLGYLTYVFDPLDLIVNSMTTMQPGSFLFNLWTEPPLEMLARVYIFNVTNAEEFLAGKEKLRVEEIGPYTYQEILKNTEGKLNDNGTITFKPVREHVFRRELSVGDESSDMIIVPNVPLLGIGSVLTKFNSFINFGFNMMLGDTKQFLNLTVKEFLWGYEDHLVTLASTFIPSWIDFPAFGIMDRFSALDAGNTVTMYVNENTDDPDNIIHAYSIDKFNGSPGLKQWDYVDMEGNETSEANSKCNTVRGDYDGGLFSRTLPINGSITMYRRAFCRPVDLLFENATINQDGFKVYNYRVDPDFLKSGNENPKNKCYCKNGECLPNGFNSLAPCYYDIPIAISQPHYLNADEEIMNQVDGLHPNVEKHDTTAQVNPDIGIPLGAKLRIQVNLNVGHSRIISKMRPFNNLMLPLCWLELDIKDPPPHIKFLLNTVLHVLPIVQKVMMWLLGILGISMIAVSALIVFYFPPQRKLEDPFHRIGYSPILVIPLSSRLKPDMRIS